MTVKGSQITKSFFSHMNSIVAPVVIGSALVMGWGGYQWATQPPVLQSNQQHTHLARQNSKLVIDIRPTTSYKPEQQQQPTSDTHQQIASKGKRRAVYSFGYGQFGQLMSGNESDVFTPKRINMDSSKVEAIKASIKTSALLANNGQLYTCGYGKSNCLGVASTNDVTKPIWIPVETNNAPLVQLTLSEFGGAVIDNKGVLYTWGRNWNGENGQESKSPTPAVVPHFHPIRGVARGRQHTIFFNEQGQVFACGSAMDGALGLPASVATGKDNVMVPVHVPGLENIVQVACGRDFSFALGNRGEVYSWGKDRWGQLGQGGSNDLQREPKQIKNLPPIRQVDCGENFTAVVTFHGELYLCGNGSDGQLGQGSNRSSDVSSFQRVETLPRPVVQVSCGGGHVACVLDNGKLMIWGRGRNGQLGRGDQVESVASPRLTPVECTFFADKHVLQVSCGADHTLVLVEEDDE